MTADDVRDLRRAAELLQNAVGFFEVVKATYLERDTLAATLERLAAVQEPKIGSLPPCIACGHIVPFHYARCRLATTGSQQRDVDSFYG